MLCASIRVCFGILGFLAIPYEFGEKLFPFIQKDLWILLWIQ
jgi:hypothetical protein